MVKKYKVIALILAGMLSCLIAGGTGGVSSGINIQETKKSLIENPSSYNVDYKRIFEKDRRNKKLSKKLAMVRLSAGLAAYNEGLYSIASKHLKASRKNKYVKDLLRRNSHFSLEQVIEKCGDVDCPKCLGSGKVDCSKCSGSGWILCRKCKGTGISSDYESRISRVNRNNACVKCDGLTVVKCDNCQASGLVNCPKLPDSQSGTNKKLYDPMSDDIKRLLAISTYLVNCGTDIYSDSGLEKSVIVSN